MPSRLFISLLVLLTSAATAQEVPPRPEPQVVELAVSPAAELAPALKHRLLPPYLDQRDENAAPLYLRALLMLETSGVEADDKLWNNIIDWAKADIDKLPRDEAHKALGQFASVLGELRLAARRTQCDWALGVRERENIFATLLPEVQAMRNLARLLALEARLHIAEGKYAEAVATLQVGYALARHVAEQPFLISGLVGAAIAQQMNDQLETLLAAAGSPNMYWAIAALPDPLIDLRPALDLEGHSMLLMLPKLRDVRERELTPEGWRQEFRDTIRAAGELMKFVEPEEDKGLGGAAKELARAAAIEAMLELRYPQARKELAAWGYDEKRLDAMPKGQAVLVHEVEHFERTRDGLFKWFDVPYWEAYDGLRAADAAFAERAKKRDKLTPPPLADLVLPALTNVYNAQTRGERRLAALQTIESLRMYAAAHEGRWPMTLADEDLAPAPRNPFTGNPPDYAVADGVATVIFAGRGREADLVYKLRIDE